MSAKRNPGIQVFTACILKHAQESLSVMNIGKDKPSVAAATPTVRSTPQTAQPASHIQKPQATTLMFSRTGRSANALAKPSQVVKPAAATTRTLAKITGTVLAIQQVTKPTPAESNFHATSTLQEYILNKNQSPVVTKKVKVKRSLTSSTDTLKKGENPTLPVLIRINVRKTLQKLLQSRIQECPDLTVAEEEVQKIALNIEEELHDFFKDTGIKYKSKYRSLAFNIKDPKNLTLFRKIADKSVTPHQLVRLSPEELASQELAQWRERETKHQLEIIKRNELDLMTLSKRYVMKTHKGIQVIETEESLKTVVPELIDPASEPDIFSAINNSFSSTLEGTSSKPEKGKSNDKGKVRDKQKYDKNRCSEDQDRSSKQDGKRRHGHEWEHSKDKEETRQGREKESESIHSREKGIQFIGTVESLNTVVPELIDPASEPDIVSAINNSFSSTLEGTSSKPEKGKSNDKGKDRDKQKDDKKRSEDQDRSKQDGKRRHGHEWEHSKDKDETRQGREKESESIHSREKGIQLIETEESLKTVVPELKDPVSEPDIVSAFINSVSLTLKGTSLMPEKGHSNDKGKNEKIRDRQKEDKKRCLEDQDRSSKQDGKWRHGHEWEHSKDKEETGRGKEKESESIHSREKGIQLIETEESLKTVVPELKDPASEPDIVSALINSVSLTLKGTSSKPEKGNSNDKGKNEKIRDRQKEDKKRCLEDKDRSSKQDSKWRHGHEWEHSKDKEETRWGREKESESIYSRERVICKRWFKYHHYSSEREKDKRSREDKHEDDSKKKIKMREIKMMTEKEEEIRLKQRVLNDLTPEINYLKNEELAELKHQLENLMKKLEDSTNQLVATDQKYQKQLSKTIEYSKMLVKMEDKLAKRQKVIDLNRYEISKLKETIQNLRMGQSREAPPVPPSGEGEAPLNMKADVPPQQQAVTFDFWHRFPQLFHGYDIPEGATASQPVVARECTKKEICSLNCDSPTLGMLATNHSDDMTFYIGQSLVRKFGKSKSPPSQRTKPYTCETCGKRFTLRGSLKTHEKLHAFRETYHCHICGKSFKVEGGLRSHAVLHTNHRPFMCMVCGKGFTLKGSLKTHLALHSVHRATFPCDICGKTYKGRASFDSHKAQHLGQPLYQCEVCGKNFTLKGSLKLHAMLHSGLKPYTCQACGMGFAIRSHLTRHFRMHMLR